MATHLSVPHPTAGLGRELRALDEFIHFNHKLELACSACGKQEWYNVGAIIFPPKEAGSFDLPHCSFTKYFRCVECGSPGPWEMVDTLKISELAIQASNGNPERGVFRGKVSLFDGTSHPTPAMAEDHLRLLLEKDPQNSFIHTRLGNLLRNSGEEAKSKGCYARALEMDEGNVEARYHLFRFAANEGDLPAALSHGPQLVRHLIEGRNANPETLTAALALDLVDLLLSAPLEFRTGLFGGPQPAVEPPERTFIRTLLQQEGEHEEIVKAGAERLVAGQTEPPAKPVVNSECQRTHPDLVFSLREFVQVHRLNTRQLTVPMEKDGLKGIRVQDRHSVPVCDQTQIVYWRASSLRELFRGNRPAPSDISRYLLEYGHHFFFIERHLLMLCDGMGDRTDGEMEEIYSMLRRRPDGRSTGPAHDFLWQVAALMLGMHPLSREEFEFIFGRLARSARGWKEGVISRNYAAYLRSRLQ
jgi:tetratricopeptide (TPR) repeat protein